MDAVKVDAVKVPIRNLNNNLKFTFLHIREPTSLTSLIVWNISKALEKNPTLNIKEAVTSAQNRLEHVSEAEEIQALSNNPHERHLACAILAWQQLGHRGADSLCRFIESKTKNEDRPSNLPNDRATLTKESLSRTSKASLARASRASKISTKIEPPGNYSVPQQTGGFRYEEADTFTSFSSFAMGPVIKLPVETQIVMRLDNTSRYQGKQCKKPPKAPEKDVINKINQVCCLDSACAERLAAMDATSSELRARAGTLARREAERVELLERAEAAWRDLELGYQRRLALAQEKEEDIAKQVTRMLEERNAYKNACTTLAKDLKDRSGRAEIERAALSEIEKLVCERACERMRASEECAKGDAVVAEQSCKAAQLDRDLQIKEETARRNMLALQNEVSAVRSLTCDVERATRRELAALRDQIAEVSRNLLAEDDVNASTRDELELLRQEKMEIIEDLDGCKVTCDSNMKGMMDDLNAKRDQLSKLREKVMECKCKVPVDVAVEVKRTPSLVALCKCTPEDKVLSSCSCTSMRTKLLANLFADLFSGLQSEVKGAIGLMPCQLLKCLEDKYNWDKPSAVKTNLKNYFWKLLVGELDIAIATSIENYHAKWVGISCADARSRMAPGPNDDAESEGWQERAIERRAQKLATKLAEQLFQERAEELTRRAQDIINAGPPPCECDLRVKLPEGCTCGKETERPPSPSTQATQAPAAPDAATQVFWHQAMQIGGPPERDYNVEVERKLAKKGYGKACVHGRDTRKPDALAKSVTLSSPPVTPLYWQQALHDVTQLRHQIEDLRKDTIKKEDLKTMEEKIAKIIRASGASTSQKMKYITDGNVTNDATKNTKINRNINQSKLHFYEVDKSASKKKNFGSLAKENKTKPSKKINQAYAVNVCLCSTKRQEQRGLKERRKLETSSWKQKDTFSQMSSTIRQTKPIYDSFISQDSQSYNIENDEKCPSNCACFHKIPSNTSLDRLLDTLSKWKGDLDASFTAKYPQKTPWCNVIKSNDRSSLEVNTFDSKTSLKSKEKSQETSKTNIKLLAKMSAKSAGPINAESVYMGAVNLDKSHEELCNCNNSKIVSKAPFKCIASSKCDCEKHLEVTKLERQSMHIGKEEYTEISVIRTKQEQNVKDLILLPNTPNDKEIFKAELKEDININIIDKKTNAHAIKSSDYQINFLGVTLVDVNPTIKNQLLLESNYNNKQNQNDYLKKSYRPVPELTNFIDNTDKKNINISLSKDDKNEGDHFTYDINRKNNIQTYYKNKDNNENFNKHAVRLGYMEDTDVRQLHKNVKYKSSDLGHKTASDQNTSNVGCDHNQFQSLNEEVNDNVKNSQESLISEKSYKTANDSNQLFHETPPKTNDREGNLPSLSNENIKTSRSQQNLSCKCGVILDEFKKFISSNFAKHTDTEDVALDVPSLKCFKERNESCVCCSKLNNDESRDLEDNTFHLIEEYLRKKLNEFRLSTCNSFCIPAKEEEKIFAIIVQRVKQLISESTNQIACKCSPKERKSQGSWNRAYGLLQEYLKIKIKKVQCSCLLAEDNKDTILPDVLEKISNLIEYDFQRLKNIHARTLEPIIHENRDNIGKQVNFEAEMPEKDQNITLQKNFSSFPTLDDTIMNLKTYHEIRLNDLKSMQSQFPLTLAIEDENNKRKNCESNVDNTVSGLFDKNLIELQKNNNFSLNNASCTKTLDKRNAEITHEDMKTVSLANKFTEKTIKTAKENEVIDNNLLESKVEQKKLSSSCNKVYHLSNMGSKNKCDSQNNEEKQENRIQNSFELIESCIPSSSEVPYLGYTITCSCDQALGPCNCPKNISNTNPDMINDIWKKSIPDKTFFEKISYIMPKQTPERVNKNMNLQEISNETNSPGRKKKTANNNLTTEATSCVKSDIIVLKTSSSDVVKANAETNTFRVRASMDTDCSNNEGPDWCEYASQYDPGKHIDSDRLTRSIYYPAPIEYFNEQTKDYNDSNENEFSSSHKHTCHCERVPICHVKLLVEDIETKLANDNCTCDSLIQKVCPVHSKKC